MNGFFLIKFALFVLLLTIIQTSNAQVTIGSSHTPNGGALLDLKQEHTAGTANSTRGLLLPRVKLITMTPKVGELSLSIGNTGAWDEDIHTGLVVYNTINTVNACTGGAYEGVYNWDGVRWLAAYAKQPIYDPTLTTTDIYKGANSYTMPKAQTINIPIERAFKIWTDYAGSTPADGKVLNTADANGLTGVLRANVVWEEASDGTNADVIHGNARPSIIGAGAAAMLEVNSGFKTGNALVNVTLDNKVLWQWHIWVSNEDATQKGIWFNNGKQDAWMMDRYLGATANQGNQAHGLYYQWGRPTPIQKTLTTNVVAGDASEKTNLTRAIQTPDFISFANTESHDWYSPTAAQWDARWGDRSQDAAAVKSPFDPCPYGWRVTSTIDGSSPWNCLTPPSSGASNGWDFGEIGQSIGHYAASGYRSNASGSVGDVGTAAYVWTASPAGALASFLHIKGAKVDPAAKYNRANAMAVRCVKE